MNSKSFLVAAFPFLLSLIELGFLGDPKCSVKRVPECEKLSVVVAVMCVVHGVVFTAHHWLAVTPHGVMNVRSPNPREE